MHAYAYVWHGYSVWWSRSRASGELKTRSWFYKSRINFEFWRNLANTLTFLNIKITFRVPTYISSLLIYVLDLAAELKVSLSFAFDSVMFTIARKNVLDLRKKRKLSTKSNTSVHFKTMYRKKNLFFSRDSVPSLPRCCPPWVLHSWKKNTENIIHLLLFLTLKHAELIFYKINYFLPHRHRPWFSNLSKCLMRK